MEANDRNPGNPFSTPLASAVLRLYFDKPNSEIKDLQESTGKSRSISTIHGQVQSFNPEKFEFICLKRKLPEETIPTKKLLTLEDKYCIKSLKNSDYSNFDIAKLMDVHPKTITKYFDFVEKPRKVRAEISKIPESEFIEAIQ